MSYNVVITEDNGSLAKALTQKIEFFKEDLSVSYIAYNGVELISKLEDDHIIDLILMDIKMPKMDGIEATKIVKQKYPHIKIIMITVFDDDESIFKSIQNGADGYLLKESTPDEIHQGIMDVMRGGATMTPTIAMRALRLLASADVGDIEEKELIDLTKRELEVLEQLSKGLIYPEIARNLVISPGTVRKHTENIYKKLQVHNKTEAIDKAKRNRLI